MIPFTPCPFLLLDERTDNKWFFPFHNIHIYAISITIPFCLKESVKKKKKNEELIKNYSVDSPVYKKDLKELFNRSFEKQKPAVTRKFIMAEDGNVIPNAEFEQQENWYINHLWHKQRLFWLACTMYITLSVQTFNH